MHRPRSHASQLAMSTAGCGAQARGLADDMCAVESARLTARAPGAGPGPFLPGLSRAVCASPSSTVRVVSARACAPWAVDGVWLGWSPAWSSCGFASTTI